MYTGGIFITLSTSLWHVFVNFELFIIFIAVYSEKND